MQDIHSIGGGQFFGGGSGDRRLRPHHHQNHQALKCPRCDSLNTKFCYYNNYNLSQPRHFCKNCRRYWTKGGVLRNVPVGGGCRKTKRSKSKASSATTATATAPPPPSNDRKSNSNSSSESSSLTAATNTNATTEAVSAPSTSAASESKFFVSQSSNPSFEPPLIDQGGGGSGSDCGIFSEIGSFTSLITSSTGAGAMPFDQYNNLSDISISPFRLNHQHEGQDHRAQQNQSWQEQQNEHELKVQGITGSVLDQTSQVDLSVLQDRSNGGGFGSLGDWHGDQGLFDLPNTVDQAYWSQSQWSSDQDHNSLYLP